MEILRMGSRELRIKMGARLDAAHFYGEPTIVTSNSEPRAVLIGYAQWLSLMDRVQPAGRRPASRRPAPRGRRP